MSMNLFAQITKVDEAKRLVYGRAVQEVPDRADEIFDYGKSRPYFEAWSKSFSDDTDGKSLGNLRAMHGKVCAGKLTGIEFNDAEKAIDICAHIVDNNEWEKVETGCYTGFSIGGSYVGERTTEKIDGKDIKRYTASPAEISIVDAPCIPTAKFFDIVKADGVVEKREFKDTASASAENDGTGKPSPGQPGAVAAVPAPIVVTGADADIEIFAKALNDSSMTMSDAIAAVQDAAAAKVASGVVETIADMEKREFNTDQRKAAAKAGEALPDGSFPIKTVGDLENAVRAYGRAKDKAAAKAHIIKRAKALGASDKLPAAWTKSSEKVVGAELRKSMYDVSCFAETLTGIAGLARSAQYDLDDEGDNSPVPASLRNWLEDGIELFQQMSEEESTEMLAGLKQSAGVGDDDGAEMAMEQAVKIGALIKRINDTETTVLALAKMADEMLTAEERAPLKSMDDVKKALLAKVGARHSAVDAKRLQDAHDNLVAMGAECAGEKEAVQGGALAKADQDTLAKLRAEVDMLKKQPMPHVVQLRMLTKEEANKTAEPKDELLALPYKDLIKNADGVTVDWESSKALLHKA